MWHIKYMSVYLKETLPFCFWQKPRECQERYQVSLLQWQRWYWMPLLHCYGGTAERCTQVCNGEEYLCQMGEAKPSYTFPSPWVGTAREVIFQDQMVIGSILGNPPLHDFHHPEWEPPKVTPQDQMVIGFIRWDTPIHFHCLVWE